MLTLAELRRDKLGRKDFLAKPRKPITVVLDGVHQSHNIGAIFRLCDAYLVERLVICGSPVNLRNRKLVKAARGTHRWVPWTAAPNAIEVVVTAKASGAWIVAAEQTTTSVEPHATLVRFPAALVLGGETTGVSQEVLDLADVAVAVPMLGMANSLNVSTAAAILLYALAREQTK
jgi:tRNA G18 (ribose-2'-O)-methylase SpoU